ncbi:hypothetical protein [Parasphaerochaeta coccoides]|uniref:hypothetical protein n=1 Tax=Parasphaerochaeta coccoides TaxID=273376 RepID=UPI000690F711|nr:hypothetical protein [Parasphaerochaeta coccoides]
MNNGNWGIPLNKNEEIRLAPVYDNGNCLSDKWDVPKMERVLELPPKEKIGWLTEKTCIFENDGKKINPNKYILSLANIDGNKAAERLVSQIISAQPHIEKMINDIPIISEIQKRYYKESMQARLEYFLIPAYNKLRGVEMSHDVPNRGGRGR